MTARINALLALVSAALWAMATWTDWVSSVRFISHISMATMVWTGAAAAFAAHDKTVLERLDRLERRIEQLLGGTHGERH